MTSMFTVASWGMGFTSLCYNVVEMGWSRADRSRRIRPLATRVAIVLEELLHRYYLIHDEWEVKELVVPLLQSRAPDVTLHGLYPKMFDAEGRRLLPA